MRIVLTGGGTAGHVTPNLALAPRLKELGFEIYYVGTRTGMEHQLAKKEGIPFRSIHAGKLRRYLDIKNAIDLFRTGIGFLQALLILREIRPDIVFSKGGFVSCPVVWAAWVLRIPAVLHESDITPGLANRLTMPFATKICVAFPETLQHIKNGKGVLTGIPIREALRSGNASSGASNCNFNLTQPVVLVIGGSQGAESINTAIRSALPLLLKEFKVCHICGKGNMVPDLNAVQGYRQFEYVDEELPNLFAMADVVVSRAGATTLFEILALRKPNLLIPLSKRVSRGDQILNAHSFEQQGFAHVLMEEELTEEAFVKGLRDTYSNRDLYIQAMTKSGSASATDEVLKVITDHCR